MGHNFPGEALKASGDHAPKKGEGVGTLTHQLPSVVALVIKWGLLWGGATILPWVKPALCEAERAPVARGSPWCRCWKLEAQPVCGHQHLLHLSSILPFTLKDISLSLNLYIQTAFPLDNNKRKDQIILQIDFITLVIMRVPQKQMPRKRIQAPCFKLLWWSGSSQGLAQNSGLWVSGKECVQEAKCTEYISLIQDIKMPSGKSLFRPWK